MNCTSCNNSCPSESKIADYATDNLPKDLLHPGGLVEQIMNYVNDTAICQQPMFALAAALTLCGLLFGRRSSAFSAWKGKQRAPQRDKPEIPVEILCPHVCLLGMTQPQTFFSGMSRLDVQDGWLARPIFFISTTRPPARLDLPQKGIPREIVAAVENFKDEPLFENNVKIVPSTDNAKDVLRSFGEKVREIMLKSDGILRKELTRKSQYLNRSVRNECLDDLIEAGQVRVLRTGSGA